jgi:hypothetical protein
MGKRMVFIGMLVGAILVATLAFLEKKAIGPVPLDAPTEASTPGSDTDAPPTTPPKAVVPPDSGRSYHAIELLEVPESLEGKLITVDVWAIPTPIPTINGMTSYRYLRLPAEVAAPTKKMGLVFNRDLNDRVYLFDVMSENPEGDFFNGTDHIVEGQVAVEMSAPNLFPHTDQLWDLEPTGTLEGTTRQGLAVRVHKFRFWRYHVSRQDASPPTQIVVPPQTPRLPDRNSAEKLYYEDHDGSTTSDAISLIRNDYTRRDPSASSKMEDWFAEKRNMLANDDNVISVRLAQSKADPICEWIVEVKPGVHDRYRLIRMNDAASATFVARATQK